PFPRATRVTGGVMILLCKLQVLCFTGVFGLLISRAESLSDTGHAPTSDIRYSQNSSEPLNQASHSDLSSSTAGTPAKLHIHTAGNVNDKDEITRDNNDQHQIKYFDLPSKPTPRSVIRRHDSAIKILTSTKNSTSFATSTPPSEYDFTEMSVQVSVHEAPSISSYRLSKLNVGRDAPKLPKYDGPYLLPLHGSSNDESIPD
ncbi:unnamed protein product, partial [Meganyctiphanes norvegica]